MGVRLPSVFSNTFVGPLPANATETVVLTTPPINQILPGAAIILLWSFALIIGASSTNIAFRLRRGTTTAGALVNVAGFQSTCTAASGFATGGMYQDSPGEIAQLQYSLTVVQLAATGAGTFTDGSILAMVL